MFNILHGRNIVLDRARNNFLYNVTSVYNMNYNLDLQYRTKDSHANIIPMSAVSRRLSLYNLMVGNCKLKSDVQSGGKFDEYPSNV